jgi:YVTN family beta-propeller protein
MKKGLLVALLLGVASFSASGAFAQSSIIPPGPAQPNAAWDTPESIRGGMMLLASFDSSGPDAWDVAKHPMVYVTGQGGDDLSNRGIPRALPGFQLIDAYTKEVITTASFDLGTKLQAFPHGIGVSPDGKWIYVPTGVDADSGNSAIGGKSRLLVVNARTLKVDRVLVHLDGGVHHVVAFTDPDGNDRILLGSNRGSTFLLDPNDDQRVVKAITASDVPSNGERIGHPYLTADPAGKYIYQALRYGLDEHGEAGMAKVNIASGDIDLIYGLGHNGNPIASAHTADGKITYVNDGHGSHVYKIDNETNEVIAEVSAGVAGPYGLALNWDESLLFVVGKGEGSHNTGAVLGVVDTKIFKQATGLTYNMPIYLGGSARSIDHAILHPDPAVNELWVSNMRGWETIVLDLNTYTVEAYIPQVNGGNTHSGAFVKYAPDGTGELLVDMGGPQKKMFETKALAMAAPK